MKLAFCLFKYFPFGGLQRDFLKIAQMAIARGHQVDVYTRIWEGEQDKTLRIHLIKTKKLQNHTRNQEFAAKIQPYLKEYDCVVGFNKMPGLDIYYAADICFQAKTRKKHPILYRLTPRYRTHIALEKAVFTPEASTQILALSAVQQKEFVACYQTPVERFHLLPPGIDKNRIAPPDSQPLRLKIRETLGLTSDNLMLLMIGSGFKTKGLDRALKSYAALPFDLQRRTIFYIIGQDRKAPFIKLAKKLKIEKNIHFLGPRHDVERFLLAADLFLHPAYHENTGTVLLEALVAHLPVLTTAVCGYAHYIEEAKAGIVLPTPFQQTKLDHALNHLLSSKESRTTFQENARHFTKTADIFSLPEHALQYIESIKKNRNPFHAYSFVDLMKLSGTVFRDIDNRRTQRILINDQAYFIKQHFGVGWREIFKNLITGRLPIVSAKNEWRALLFLKKINILVPTIVHYENKGINPANRQSFLITKELTHTISLEDYCKEWKTHPPRFHVKKNLIIEIAKIARTMHQNGINHRDFYLCHFLLDLKKINCIQLYLIDLHRAQIRHKIPKRWRIKDLSGLYFSSLHLGLTTRDVWRFMQAYRQISLRNILHHEITFWEKVKKRGEKLYKQR